jgi:hypothetical protein
MSSPYTIQSALTVQIASMEINIQGFFARSVGSGFQANPVIAGFLTRLLNIISGKRWLTAGCRFNQ